MAATSVFATSTSAQGAAARRITRTLFATMGLASSASVPIFAVISIIGAQLGGHPSWAGIPATMYLLGTAFSAFGWGQVMDRLGRRPTLVVALAVGGGGAALALAAVELEFNWLFLAGALLIGSAVSAVQLSRFVAAEVHAPAERGRAISTVVLGGTVGAVLGPVMATAAAGLARAAALDELSGPFALTIALYAAAGLLVFIRLRPEPRELSRTIAATNNVSYAEAGPARGISEILRVPAAAVAVAAMVFGQLIMVMLMVITPLHMQGHEHHLSSISFVISAHVVGMYAFSIISGRMADRLGRGPVIVAGSAVLVLACLSARMSPDALPLSIALFLLGLGWNFCYVAGSSLLADQLSLAERARTQGFNDLLIGLTSAAGSLGSGIVFAAIGFGAMTVVAATASLIPLVFAGWWQVRARPVPATS